MLQIIGNKVGIGRDMIAVIKDSICSGNYRFGIATVGGKMPYRFEERPLISMFKSGMVVDGMQAYVFVEIKDAI